MQEFLSTYAEVFRAGGFLMYPLALLAFYLYFSGFEICFRMARWNKICSRGELFGEAYAVFLNDEFPDSKNGADIGKVFAHLRLVLMSGVERRLLSLKILSGVAPLIGLLGTVAGMMICISSAADSVSVADGISTALITTQAGLVAAIPAWIIAMFATSQTQKLLINLARRESAMIKREGK